MDSTRYDVHFIWLHCIVWHSNNVSIRLACCCILFYYVYMCVHVRLVPRSQHTQFKTYLSICEWCVCDLIGRKRKKMSITNFPFHLFASFTLLISFCLYTNKHIDARTNSRTMRIWCVFEIHWSFWMFFFSPCVEYLYIFRSMFLLLFPLIFQCAFFPFCSTLEVYSFSLTTKSNTKHT